MLQFLAASAALLSGQADASQPADTAPAADAPRLATDDDIVVEAPLLYPSVGMTNDHMHNKGEVMVGLHFERSRWSGTNRRGPKKISDEEILAAGYSSRTRAMTMDMVMLDVMYAPNDEITLMLMPHYMWHRMEMVGIDPMAGQGGGGGEHGGHGGHALAFGEVHKHKTHGFGDTLASASFRLVRKARFNAHFTIGVWIPTGDVDRKNPDGTLVHYGMQPGSGTWDVEPSFTVSGKSGPLGWGAQAAYRWRVTEANETGFRFGDKTRLNGWLSYLLLPTLGTTARLEYAHEGIVEGHFNVAHNHSSPPDRQENYGGKVVTGAIGLNWQPPLRGAFRPELGVELAIPLYQNLYGIQAPQDWMFSTAIRQTF